jgi:flavorubredoxin
MTTRTDPIADGITRISTYSPEGPPGGITFNQFVVHGDAALLFHTGPRRLFPSIRTALENVVEIPSLRFISSGQSWPDDFGALNELLELAPQAVPVHGVTGCFLFLSDLSSRPPVPLADGEVLEIGSHRVRWVDTPHVPWPWEAGMMFDEFTGTLFCGDLFSRTGDADPTTTDDIVAAAIAHDERMHGVALTPALVPTLRRLAGLMPRRLALMHGPTFVGDGAGALHAFADHFEQRLAEERTAAGSYAA